MPKVWTEENRLVFFHYAWPCAEDLLAAGKITLSAYNELKFSVVDNLPPNVYILEHCFPHAFNACLKFDTAAEYWEHHHGHDGDCAVRCGKVRSIWTNRVMVVLSGEPVHCFNIYRYYLHVGVEVFVHRRVIAEVKSATLG